MVLSLPYTYSSSKEFHKVIAQLQGKDRNINTQEIPLRYRLTLHPATGVIPYIEAPMNRQVGQARLSDKWPEPRNARGAAVNKRNEVW